MEKDQLEISWGSLWRIAVMLGLVTFFYFVSNIIIGIIFAIVISSALDPIVNFLEKKKFPRVLGTLLIFLLTIALFSLLLYIVVPIALSELNTLLENLSDMQSSIFGLKDLSGVVKLLNSDITRITNLLFSGSVSLSDVVGGLLGNLTIVFSVFILSFYLTVDRDGVEKFLRAILPPRFEDQVLDVYFRTRAKIGKWLQGQIFLSATVGFGVFLGLTLLGVKYSLVLAILAGLLEIVPFVGPIISGSLAILIALPQSLTTAIYVLILFIIIQQTENYVLVPTFMRLTTSLHPAVIIIALLIGGQFLGVIGLILAVPLAVLAQEIINNWSDFKSKRKVLI
ncbi:MAG: AI-2E family transporter [Candidatus Pacebacteria bacterium]|nr:AI-2E family transporter [Candidatus Paceibacterota bacterium]